MLYIDRSTYGSYWQQDGKIKHWNRSVSWQKFLCVCCNGLSGFIDKKLKLIWTICQQQANVIEFDILIPRYHASQLAICNIEYWFFVFDKGMKGEKKFQINTYHLVFIDTIVVVVSCWLCLVDWIFVDYIRFWLGEKTKWLIFFFWIEISNQKSLNNIRKMVNFSSLFRLINLSSS